MVENDARAAVDFAVILEALLERSGRDGLQPREGRAAQRAISCLLDHVEAIQRDHDEQHQVPRSPIVTAVAA